MPCKLSARSQISSPAAVFLLTVVDPRARRSSPRAHGHLPGAASVDSSVRNTLPHLSIRHAADSLRRLGRPLKPFPRRRLPLPGPVSLILYSIALLSARLYGLILLCLLRKTTRKGVCLFVFFLFIVHSFISYLPFQKPSSTGGAAAPHWSHCSQRTRCSRDLSQLWGPLILSSRTCSVSTS